MRILFVTVLAIIYGVTAWADLRDVYTIRDIPVSEQADTVVEAQEQAFNAARIIGAQRMIDRLTLAEDRAKVPDIIPDPELARTMSAAVDVQEEAAGGGIYRGVLSVLLNPNLVRRFLNERGVPFLERQAPLALLVPFAQGNNYFSWISALPDSEEATLTPWQTARLGRYGSDADWVQVSSEAGQFGASRAVLAELRGGVGGWEAHLTLLSPAGRQYLGRTGKQKTLSDLPDRVTRIIELHWKRQNIVRNTAQISTRADVLYTSLIEWNTLRKAFHNSPLVSEFKIIAQNRTSAIVSINHTTDRERLERDLLQRGVRITHTDGLTTIRSARFGG